MSTCIEVVGYRQRKKGITSFGDLCSDFGANVKFLLGRKKKFKRINIGNLKNQIVMPSLLLQFLDAFIWIF